MLKFIKKLSGIMQAKHIPQSGNCKQNETDAAFDPRTYDSSWDDDNEELWEEKYEKWEKRDWKRWLNESLTFPFEVKREEDNDDAFFAPKVTRKPFRLGHVMDVTGIDHEDELYGVMVKVKEGKHSGCVPLCDVEVTDKNDVNFWPVREYVVWFANR